MKQWELEPNRPQKNAEIENSLDNYIDVTPREVTPRVLATS